MFKDFETAVEKHAEYLKTTQNNVCEQVAKFPQWLHANDYLVHIPKQVLDSVNKTLDTALQLFEAGIFTFAPNDRKARNK